MTCLSAPIDIQTDGASKCSSKCLLHYKYGDSACTIRNSNTFLNFTYDGVSDVVYNNVKYKPISVFILKPSLHKYSGKTEIAEIIIMHTSNNGYLAICIPITVNAKYSKGSYLLKDLIAASPTEGSATANIADYNANYLIPRSRYYTYEGSGIGATCHASGRTQYVVFHPRYDGAISISDETYKILDKLVQPSYIAVSSGDVFVNLKGTSANGFAGDGQIYIDCQPTGVSEEEVVFKDAGTVNVYPNETLMTILMVVIGAAFIYATFVLMKFVLGNVNKVTGTNQPLK
jgi:carbonic anhydrase